MASQQFDSLMHDPERHPKPPMFHMKQALIHDLHEYKGPMIEVKSPVCSKGGDNIVIGTCPHMTAEDGVKAVKAAAAAFNGGAGEWPMMKPAQRIERVEKWLELFDARLQQEVQRLLEWEICKTQADAAKEVDRTLQYIRETITELKKVVNNESTFIQAGGVLAQVRRAPIGVALCSSPFNYPMNEAYVTFFPAILMGNCAVMKLSRQGVLLHGPMLPLFAECFPPGVVNFVVGSGRTTLPPMMETGLVDIFAFIGSSTASSDLLKSHPSPHRIRSVLGLDAKNAAIVLADADIDVAVRECISGGLSFNGQRCTALKIMFVDKRIHEEFVGKLAAAVDDLVMGLPWDKGTAITPIAEGLAKAKQLQGLIDDAVAKGAVVRTKRSGFDRSFFAPQVVDGVTSDAKLYTVEQFGPVIPVVPFDDVQEVMNYVRTSSYGQQASLFSTSSTNISPILDHLVNMVCRVNLNTAASRGPDVLPFAGRRDSGSATLSVHDALRAMSIRSMVAAKQTPDNESLVNGVLSQRTSNFLRVDYLF